MDYIRYKVRPSKLHPRFYAVTEEKVYHDRIVEGEEVNWFSDISKAEADAEDRNSKNVC